jgi:hypothetical protein
MQDLLAAPALSTRSIISVNRERTEASKAKPSAL